MFVNPRVILAPALLVAVTAGTFAQRGSSGAASFVYGTWRIERTQEVAGHGRETVAKAQERIGREIEFGRKDMSYENDLLYFDPVCRRPAYAVKKQKLSRHDVREKGTLEFYDLGPRRRGWIEYVTVKCEDGAEYDFERAESGRLAIYYDGWFFFLAKVPK